MTITTQTGSFASLFKTSVNSMIIGKPENDVYLTVSTYTVRNKPLIPTIAAVSQQLFYFINSPIRFIFHWDNDVDGCQ